MLFIKDGIKIGVNNPVCFDLFRKQGWKPVDEVIQVTEETVKDNHDVKNGNGIDKPTYKKNDFTTWSKEKILEVAKSLGYTITATKKADMIEEFLAQQNK